jgi:pyridoxine 4-dehydrogenase
VTVTRIGLGTNRLTHNGEHMAFLREAVAAGVQLIDTAYLYAGGQSEETIGDALRPVPDGVVIATKGGYEPGMGRPDVLREQIETSLRRLRTDTIELYYLHRVDPRTPLEESVGALRDAVDRGQVRRVGLSQVSVEQIERARRIVPIAAVQNHYNLTERSWDDVVDHCAQEGIAFVPYFPLHGGGGGEVDRIAKRHGASPHQVTLAWLLRRSPTMLPIPGTLSLAHVREDLEALDLELSDEAFESLR